MSYPEFGYLPDFASIVNVEIASQSLAKEMRDDEEFVREIIGGEIDLGADSRADLMEKYAKMGGACALVVDLVVREVPPQSRTLFEWLRDRGGPDPVYWPESWLASAVDLSNSSCTAANESAEQAPTPVSLTKDKRGEPMTVEQDETDSNPPQQDMPSSEATTTPATREERLAAARKLIEDAKNTKVSESRVPWLIPTVKFDGFEKLPTGYSTLLRRVTPPYLRYEMLREEYTSGYRRTADALGLEEVSLDQGRRIVNRAPSKLLVVPIDDRPKEMDVITVDGIQITLPKSRPEDTLGTLPLSAEALWQRTRATDAILPSSASIRALWRTIRGNRKRQLYKGTDFIPTDLQ